MINGSYGSGGTWTGTKKPTVKPAFESFNQVRDRLAREKAEREANKTVYQTPPSGNKGVGQTGVTDGARGSQLAGALASGSNVNRTPTWNTPTTQATQSYEAPVVQSSTPTGTDATGKPVRIPGEAWAKFSKRQADWRKANNLTLHSSGRTISKDSNQWDDADRRAVYVARAAELGNTPGQHTKPYHREQEQREFEQQWKAKQEYDKIMQNSNWSDERQAAVDQLWRDRMINYDEYMEGAHDMVSDGQGGYTSQGNTTVGYRPDGSFGWYDKRDYPGWSKDMGQEHYAPKLDDLNAARSQGYDVSNVSRDQAAALARGETPPPGTIPMRDTGRGAVEYRVPRPAEWGQPQQQQWGSAPQGTMAGNYGWGAGLGGPPQQQQMPQWGQPPQQQQQMMPQWGQPQQSSQQQQWAMQPWGGQQQQQAMPQWGGAPQQQAMPQWGKMMQQQPMGGPMAGMEAARMGGGAMQQMGGGSPWASMWGDPFAGRQMTTDPNSPAMGGLPQMDPAQQLLMQMQGMGGGLSGGFGAGGGSSGGGGMSGGGDGAYQTPQSGVGGAAQAGGGDPYGSLASILALFAGGGAGSGGGGGGAAYNPMYGGLPRNGLFYADLMGAGG